MNSCNCKVDRASITSELYCISVQVEDRPMFTDGGYNDFVGLEEGEDSDPHDPKVRT